MAHNAWAKKSLLAILVLSVVCVSSLVALWEPTSVDGWELLNLLKTRTNPWDRLLFYVRHSFFESNPRFGQLFLFITVTIPGSRALLTPLFFGALWLVMFTYAWGRWPRAGSWQDFRRLLLLLGLFWISVPHPGLLIGFRPIATNYLYTLTWQLVLLLPYRLSCSSHPARWEPHLSSPVGILAIFIWSLGAGMANEHTGPTGIMVLLTFITYRRFIISQVPLWMISGSTGFTLGFLLLLLAPGQMKRYDGQGESAGTWQLVLERGFSGLLELYGRFFLLALPTLAILIGTLGWKLFRDRRLRDPREPFPSLLSTTLPYVAVALAIVTTLIASPRLPERLFFAPALLLVIAAATSLDPIIRSSRAHAIVTATSLTIHFYSSWTLFDVYCQAHRDWQQRWTILSSARANKPVSLPLYSQVEMTHWFRGDDFTIDKWRYFAESYLEIGPILLQVGETAPSHLAIDKGRVVLETFFQGQASNRSVPSFEFVRKYSMADLQKRLEHLDSMLENADLATLIDEVRLRFYDVELPPPLNELDLYLGTWKQGHLTLPQGRFVPQKNGRRRVEMTRVDPTLPRHFIFGPQHKLIEIPTTSDITVSYQFQHWGAGYYDLFACGTELCYFVARTRIGS